MEKTLIYKIGGPHHGPNGLTYEFKEATLGAKPEKGWFSTLIEAVLDNNKKHLK